MTSVGLLQPFSIKTSTGANLDHWITQKKRWREMASEIRCKSPVETTFSAEMEGSS